MDSLTSRMSDISLVSLGPEDEQSFVHWKMKTGTGSSSREPDVREGAVYLASSAAQYHTATRDKLSKKPTRGRQNSLRHVKNSTDLLRQRSLKGQKPELTPDVTTGAREGRQFTVGNVGTNGLIYLRPVINPIHQKQPAQAFVLPPVTPPQSAHIDEAAPERGPEETVRHSVWSNSQRSEAPRKPSQRANHETPSDTPTSKQSHTRAQSFSTIEGSRRSSGLKPGVFRIVIDRSDSTKRPQTAEQLGFPTLEVPIPHYRLGTPRFSEQGTPALRSSSYTRTSVSDNFRSSTLPRGEYEKFPVPPGTGATDGYPQGLGLSSSSLQPATIRTTGMSGVTRSSAALPSPVFYKVQEPIEPVIFDDLATHMNDPSVVRISPRTGEITAASPARIVAQISSESFMDYELVSDFFLTFRSYLSPQNLLGLLLARLHWAINRLESDGRIIRIRTFAALRHWILNYFVDDFAVNRDLRVMFCDKINGMYREVKARTRGGHSDLKILLDLKRCWNGRCSLYWDTVPAPGFGASPDADIKPGGVIGSRDSDLSRLPPTPTTPTMAVPTDAGNVAEQQKTAVQTWFGDVPIQLQGHERQVSETSVEIPISPVSDQSMQVISCSFPAKAFKRSPSPSDRPRGPRPVLVPIVTAASTPPTASLAPAPAQSAWRKPTHAHKRSGSFSDSVRDDRSPLPASGQDKQQTIVMAFPYAGSLIRGNVYPPSPPYIDVLAPLSPRHNNAQYEGDGAALVDGGLRINAMGQNQYRSLFGSIRRALSSRQSGSHHPQSLPSQGQPGPSIRGKTSTLPLNVAYHADGPTRERRAAHGTRSQMRIDLLCAEVGHAYKAAGARLSDLVLPSHEGIGVALGNEREQPSPFFADGSSVAGLGQPRYPSVVTAGSKSIVIVDDTGLDMPDLPAMSGALDTTTDPVRTEENPGAGDALNYLQTVAAQPLSPTRESKMSVRSERLQRSSSLDRGFFEDRARSREASQQISHDGSFHFGRTSSTKRSKRAVSEGPSSSLLRRYASYQSGVSSHAAKPSPDEQTTRSGTARESLEELFDKAPARLLRRRPGGDLRNVKNVHDLELVPRPHSAGSATTMSDSIGGSVLYMARNRNVGAPQSFSPLSPNFQKPKSPALSLIRTHSSQHMRPSFEAAVAGFSAIPDDEDGGIEATLLRLEGKYQKPAPKPKRQPEALDDGAEDPHDSAEKRKHRNKWIDQDGISATPEPFQNSAGGASAASGESLAKSVRHSPIFGLATASVAASEDSYSSVPLLERGLSDEIKKTPRASPMRPDVAVPRPLFSRHNTEDDAARESVHSSIDVVEETESMKRIAQDTAAPQVSPTAGSFLLDENENLTDLSSEMSVEIVDASEVMDHPLSSASDRLARGTLLGVNSPPGSGRHPPSPPTTMDNPLSVTSQANVTAFQHGPLTPDPSPTTRSAPFGSTGVEGVQLRDATPTPTLRTGATPVPSPGHLPFILACESETLAQQFTIVEKAALSELDWKDLVDMRWTTRPPVFLNWVQFLTAQEQKGVDLVIARFNIVVKWALSEIVMTKDIGERARTISKYIHVAAQCRRLHNYATMLQLTIALTSVDCTRLNKTWDLVPSDDKQTLKTLETLIQPVRNFHDLRAEMETADLQDGCIPFVGLYVHDLTYNAQKPAQIASTRDGEPLVNFERYRTAATIVKGLLRLIDSSSKYTFQPVGGVIERCLWMATLPDEKIQAMSQNLE